ncbi:methyl-accepting chemotaxis protein [Aquisalimonas asiatica]|uniref:Methyl-accepting chemotaxis protein n=1 Tax=Aquisalimonas asiatica TaxID=406100 RepID=A0A1H8SUW5_9GAMM|nr:methyl-accepting chemotaxis protein [Aquisalimonas asiatica]SEO81983.1 methyl-accepting chemotaxis protein [Aquisalimonas asiatica]
MRFTSTLTQRSMTWKLVLAMGAVIVITVAMAVAMQYRLFGTMLEDRVTDTELPAILDSVSNDVGRQLEGPLGVARGMAENTFIRQWLRDGEPESGREAITDYLGHLQDDLGAVSVNIASKETGHYLESEGITRQLERGDPDHSWFYDFIDSGAFERLSIDVDLNTGVYTLYVNYRIDFDGEPGGNASVGYRLDEMTDLVADTRVGDTGRAFLVDGSGDVSVHPDGREASGIPLAEQLGISDADARSLLDGDGFRSIEVTDSAGERQIIAARTLPGIDWMAVARIPASELYSELNQAVSWVALMGVAIISAGLLAVAVLIRRMVGPLRQLAGTLRQLGGQGGDLRTRLDDSRTDEIGDLARGFNAFVADLQGIVDRVAQRSDDLQQAVATVSDQINQAADHAARQAEQTNEVATAVNEMGSTVQEIARNTSEVAQLATETNQTGEQGRQTVAENVASIQALSSTMQDAGQAMNGLATEVDSITTVLDAISGISEQTNLLALNAAIEAARAGDQGRGFAVVADEVRTLARRTQESTGEIRGTIERLQSSAKSVSRSMDDGHTMTTRCVDQSERSGEALRQIGDRVGTINDMTHQVASATEEQTSATEEINRTITSIADLGRRTSTVSETCRSECERMQALASELEQLMRRFRT